MIDYDRIYEERRPIYDRLRQIYNPEGSTLRNYQLHLAQVLKDFDTVCRENGITYHMAYGTLLGAVRHHGFIPWDDDADLWMDIENYRKLESLMRGEHHELIPDKLYVTMGVRPELWAPPFAYIDIFVQYPSPNNLFLRYLKETRILFLYFMQKTRGKMRGKLSKSMLRYAPFIPIAALGSFDFWKRRRNKALEWLTDEKYTKGTKVRQEYNSDFAGVRFKFPTDPEVWEVCRMEFEGIELNAPKGFEQLLTLCYGDFMKVPDADHLHVHGITEMVKDDF